MLHKKSVAFPAPGPKLCFGALEVGQEIGKHRQIELTGCLVKRYGNVGVREEEGLGEMKIS